MYVCVCSSGQEVQRISVIHNLPDLLRDTESHDECMRRVVPKVRVSAVKFRSRYKCNKIALSQINVTSLLSKGRCSTPLNLLEEIVHQG